MKVCLINNLFEPFARGGAEEVIKNIALGFLERGDEVIIITTKPWFKKINETSGEFKIYFLNSFYHFLPRLPRSLRLFWHIWDCFNFITTRRIKKILELEKVDLVITNNMAGLSKMSLKFAGIKQVHILHDIQLLHPSGLMFYGQERILDSLPAKIYQQLTNNYCRQIKTVISPSEWLLNLHLQRNFFLQAKKLIAANPMPIKQSHQTNDRADDFRILYVGQLEEHKGIMFLLNSWTELKKSIDDKVFLEIIGDGSLKADVEILASRNKSISVAGKLKRAEVLKRMSESNLLIVPSLGYENYPTVILEAISQNLPVLAANLGGIPEIIKSAGGILFKSADRQSLLTELEKIIKNPQLLEEIRIKYAQTVSSRQSIGEYIDDLLKTIS
jgi:glycosyltransferase involved in cell wall biosynthesis